jgi:t-SNARE complex subunit (syntaxin)
MAQVAVCSEINTKHTALFHIRCYFISVVICIVCVLSVCKCVLSPGDNPTAVNKYY